MGSASLFYEMGLVRSLRSCEGACMRFMRSWIVALIVPLALVACGGGDDPTAATSDPPVGEEDDYEAPALEIPDACSKVSDELELWTEAASWADAKGRSYEIGELCLSVPADTAFTVTLHNVKTKGVLNLPHIFSIYSDSAALDRLFYEEPVKVGKDRTFEVLALAAGPYLFRCDLHANQMKGILVVE